MVTSEFVSVVVFSTGAGCACIPALVGIFVACCKPGDELEEEDEFGWEAPRSSSRAAADGAPRPSELLIPPVSPRAEMLNQRLLRAPSVNEPSPHGASPASGHSPPYQRSHPTGGADHHAVVLSQHGTPRSANGDDSLSHRVAKFLRTGSGELHDAASPGAGGLELSYPPPGGAAIGNGGGGTPGSRGRTPSGNFASHLSPSVLRAAAAAASRWAMGN